MVSAMLTSLSTTRRQALADLARQNLATTRTLACVGLQSARDIRDARAELRAAEGRVAA